MPKKKAVSPNPDPRSISPLKKANSLKRVKTATPGNNKKVKRTDELDETCSSMKKVQVSPHQEAKDEDENLMDVDPQPDEANAAADAATDPTPAKVERKLVDFNDEFLLRAPIKLLMKYHRQMKTDVSLRLESRVLEGRLKAEQKPAVVKGLPRHCVPVRTDIRKFEWERLGDTLLEKTGRKFDLIMMDPPWQLATADPTRGVCIAYDCLPDDSILNIPVEKVQDAGFLLIWTINSKMLLTRKMYEKWGYEVLDSITWVKQSVNNRIASGHGYYLQHAFEICLVGVKRGDQAEEAKKRLAEIHQEGVASDIIFAPRRGQSQKPREIYEYCEALVPGGNFLEVFGRQHNCRDFWVTIGNEC